jgi:hypothetical protein
MASSAAAGGPGPARSSWWSAHRSTAVIVAIVAVVAVLIVALAVTQGGAASAGSNGPTRAVSVAAGPVATVDFQGVPGQLTLVGSSGSQVQLTGQLDWHSHAAAATETARTAGNVLHLTARCARRSPCTENYRLTVPAHTSVVLATSADISATGLRSPSLDATITSTHLSASFTGPARQIRLTLKSAQATIRLPGAARYLVSQQVTWGYIKVGIPQSASSSRHIEARLISSELELLP